MLKKIGFTNLRGQTNTHQAYKINKVRGRTGGGKSTIKEAISFLFSGADSFGGRAPTHLISSGEDKLKVRIETERAVLERSLTVKKNSTFKLERAGVSNQIAQKDIERLVGSSDLFLSIFSAGYFLTLPEARKAGILHELLPAIDRYEILQEMLDFELTDAHKGICKINDKRADLCASEVAEQRRVLKSTLDYKKGTLSELEKKKHPGNPPVKPEAEEAELKKQESLRSQWETYRTDMAAYEANKKVRDSALKKNKTLQKKKDEIDKQISGLQVVEVKETNEDIKNRYKPMLDDVAKQKADIVFPPAFSEQSLPDSERCPTCAQIVGTKHKESIKILNEQKRKEYEDAYADARSNHDHLTEISKKILKEMEDAIEAIRSANDHNRNVTSMKESLEREKQSLVEEIVPDAVKTPKEPLEEYNEERTTELRGVLSRYNTDLAIYEKELNQFDKAGGEKEQLAGEISSLDGAVGRLYALEQACKEVPQRELKRQAELLSMKEYVLSLEPRINLYHKETKLPYESLSDGEKIRAATHLSLKLNSLIRKNPINMVFVDNADLLDKIAWQDLIEVCVQSGIQLFFACVDEKAEKAYIENINL